MLLKIIHILERLEFYFFEPPKHGREGRVGVDQEIILWKISCFLQKLKCYQFT